MRVSKLRNRLSTLRNEEQCKPALDVIDSFCLAASFGAQDADAEFKISDLRGRIGQFRVDCHRSWLALAGCRNRCRFETDIGHLAQDRQY
jgi:hypothetical protein